MIAFLRTWILNIVTVILFITLLEILLPNSNMKKYIKMIIGLLVMLVILNPLLELANGKVEFEDEIFRTSTEIDQKILSNHIEQFGKTQDQQWMDLYKEKIENNIKDRIKYHNDIDVIGVNAEIEEDKNSKNFGNIKSLDITLPNDLESKKETKGIEPVSQIVVNVGKNQENDVETEKNPQMVNEIKGNIASLYDIDKKNIKVYREKE